jgi:2-iminobutanoate/2-iminopropanoate deaminase
MNAISHDRPHRESYGLEGISHTVPIPFGTRVGNVLFSSGIMGVDPSTGCLADGLAAQVRFAFSNMEALLLKAGGRSGRYRSCDFVSDEVIARSPTQLTQLPV